MGVAIRAAIIVGTAAAVYGVAKLRDTSQQATQAINGTNAAAAKTAPSVNRLANAFSVLRSGVAAVKGGPVSAFKGALSGANRGGILGAMFGHGQVQKQTAGMTPAQIRQMNKDNDVALATTRQAVSGMNALTGVAKEARSWYKLLFGTVGSGSKNAASSIKAVVTATKAVSQGAKEATSSFSSLSAMFAGTLAAMGGTALLSGSGGIFERAFDLSRSKEDAKTTFDTLLGSRVLTDDLMSRIEKYAAKTPFQTADIRAASQNLMSITGKDVNKNEHLYQLASSMAALRPGTTVEDASQAILRATFGEFDPLKTFTISMSAAKMKGAGETGGKQYAEAVIKEIEAQFSQKTGGRDIVGALSTTMTGLMSTIKDSLDIPLGNIGDALVEGLGIKGLMTGYIEQATMFGEYFAQLLDPERITKAVANPKMSSAVMAIADAVFSAITRVISVGKTLIGWAKMAWAWFDSLGSGIQSAMLGAAAGSTVFATAVGIITPIIVGLAAVVSVLWAPIAAVGEAIAAIGFTGFAAATVALSIVIAGVTSAFMVFRREGESFTGTMMRLGGYISAGFMFAWQNLTTVFLAFWGVVQPKLLPAWERIERAFARIRPYFVEVMNLMSGTTLTTQDLADFGAALGDVFLRLLDVTISLIEIGLYGIAAAMEYLQPMWGHAISDMKLMYKTLFALIGGTTTFKEALKTLFYGTIDLVTVPFRLTISYLFDMVSVALVKAAEMVRPFSALVADNINTAAKSAVSAAQSVNEGFLKTRQDLLGTDFSLAVNLSGDVSASVPVQLNLDGERLAESQARVAMRARNSGRGGDPMTPEEMGFVINDGRIRTVDMSAVSSSAAGGG